MSRQCVCYHFRGFAVRVRFLPPKMLLSILKMMFAIFCQIMVLHHAHVMAQPEGSGEVCNVDGSTCPFDKCCLDTQCGVEGGDYNCCEDPKYPGMEFSKYVVSEEGLRKKCANCPKCSSKYYRNILRWRGC